MTTFDYAQLEQLWIGAGGQRQLAPIAAAIAMAESGGRSDAQNASGASGLWQILGNPFPGDPFNPETNARMAVAKWREAPNGGDNFSPWVTFTDGAYKKFLQGGQPPGGPGPTPGAPQTTGFFTIWNTVPGTGIPIGWISGTAGTVADAATALGQLNNDVSEFLGWIAWLFVPSHWIRILAFVTGAPLVVVGVITMTRTGRAYQMTVSVPGAGQQSVPVAGGQLAPALGIAEVTLGAILLFIAFHQLPQSVQTFPQFVSYLQSRVGTAAGSKLGPGPGGGGGGGVL